MWISIYCLNIVNVDNLNLYFLNGSYKNLIITKNLYQFYYNINLEYGRTDTTYQETCLLLGGLF